MNSTSAKTGADGEAEDNLDFTSNRAMPRYPSKVDRRKKIVL
jgi:hypothetical protein